MDRVKQVLMNQAIQYFTDLPENWNEYELKKAYKALAIMNHPDKGGNVEVFKLIANEYDFLRENIGLPVAPKHEIVDFESFLASIDPEIYEVYTNTQVIEVPFDLEIIGDWLWLKCEKEDRENFKEIGYKWHAKRKLWFYKPSSYGKFYSKGKKGMDELRDSYGSVKTPKRKRVAA